MDVVTYSLMNGQKTSDHYYNIVSVFTDKVLLKGHQVLRAHIDDYHSEIHHNEMHTDRSTFFEEGLLEILALGIYWRIYSNAALEMKKSTSNFLTEINRLRDTKAKLKSFFNHLKGIFSTLLISKKIYITNTDVPDLTGIEKLIAFLKATGEFNQEVKRFEIWLKYFRQAGIKKTHQVLSTAVSFTDWFVEESESALMQFTPKIQDFLNNKLSSHKWKEDYIFCGSRAVEYYLNMVGAEIMNRIYHDAFRQRTDKVLLLPHCMTEPEKGKCKATLAGMGYICTGCSEGCQVNRLTRFGKQNRLRVRLVPHESSIASTKTDHSLFTDHSGVIGVSCVLNLISGGWMLLERGVIPQCVLLDYCGCKNHWHKKGISTSLNEEQLMKLIDANHIRL